MEPARVAGWARQGVAFGPFQREACLAVAVSLLNGHNGSHSGGIDGGLRRRYRDWLRGPGGRGVGRRLLDFARSDDKRQSLWLLHWWLGRALRLASGDMIEENLAVGGFPDAEPSEPLRTGHGLVSRLFPAEMSTLATSVRGGASVAFPAFNVPRTT